MTLSEFKAWFEGYTEGLEAAPTKAQFDRIKEKVKEIDGTPVTPIYIDLTWPRAIPRWPYYSITGDSVAQSVAFDGTSAMHALGRAEASN